MSLADLCALVMVAGAVVYIVLGGADFGTGVWDLTAGGPSRGARVRGMLHRSMAPVWEVNHVWLIFVLVIFWTAFPTGFTAVTTTLEVPLFIAGLGIVLRGAAFALRGEASTMAEHRTFGALFALSSMAIPFFLGATAGGVASGRVPAGGGGDAFTSWINPTSMLAGAIAVFTGAYLAAVYLAADSARSGLPDLVRAFKARALGAAVATGALAVIGLAVVHSDARPLFDGLTSWPGWALVALSGVAGVATVWLVWRERWGLARVSAALAVAAVAGGWVAAQWPDLLPPGRLTIVAAAAPHSTLVVLLVALALGLAVLIPSLVYLFRLVLRGDLDKELRPMTAGQETTPP